MAKYSHLEKLQVSGKTQRFHFDELLEADEHMENPPVLLIKCAANNTDYELRINERRAKLIRDHNKRNKGKGRKLGQDRLLQLLREPDREAYPGTILVGWEKNTDENGKEVAYSEEEAKLWLKALPDWLFDRLRIYCLDPANFTNIRMDEQEEDELAGN